MFTALLYWIDSKNYYLWHKYLNPEDNSTIFTLCVPSPRVRLILSSFIKAVALRSFLKISFPPQVETVFGSPNMTVAYHVTGSDTVYPPSVILDALESYGRDKLIADLRQYLPMVTALPVPVAPWRPIPTSSFQLKTGQRIFIWGKTCSAGELIVGLCFSSAVCGHGRWSSVLLVLSDDGTKAGEGVLWSTGKSAQHQQQTVHPGTVLSHTFSCVWVGFCAF